MKKSILAHLISTSFLISSQVDSQVLQKAPADLAILNVITGFKSHIDKTSGLEFKVFEIDGSGSVAMNSVYLYLGITNNQFGTDERSTLLKLPQVSKLVDVRFSKTSSQLEIDALFDQPSLDDSPIQSIPGTILIPISTKEGKFPNKVEATVKHHRKAK